MVYSSPLIVADELGNPESGSRPALSAGLFAFQGRRTLPLPLLNCRLMAAYRVAIVSALLAVLAESPTMDVRPDRRAPYVSCASGCGSAMSKSMPMVTHRLSDCSIPRDLSVLHKHMSPGDSDICKLSVSCGPARKETSSLPGCNHYQYHHDPSSFRYHQC